MLPARALAAVLPPVTGLGSVSSTDFYVASEFRFRTLSTGDSAWIKKVLPSLRERLHRPPPCGLAAQSIPFVDLLRRTCHASDPSPELSLALLRGEVIRSEPRRSHDVSQLEDPKGAGLSPVNFPAESPSVAPLLAAATR